MRHLYEEFRARYPDVPAYEDFRSAGYLEHPPHPEDQRVLLGEFRQDPERHPLPTPSGRIELFSSTIAGFDYPDCPPHASFLEPKEWLGNAWEFPLHLVSNQPSTRLHSQLDHGQVSVERKLHGRERLRMHPADAAARGLVDGATVRVFNGRGACFASLELTDAIRPGVVELPTGAWFDPVSVDEPSPCRHGNPNVLTRDAGTSSLAQGPVAQSCLVEVEAAPDAPEPDPFRTPLLITRR